MVVQLKTKEARKRVRTLIVEEWGIKKTNDPVYMNDNLTKQLSVLIQRSKEPI